MKDLSDIMCNLYTLKLTDKISNTSILILLDFIKNNCAF